MQTAPESIEPHRIGRVNLAEPERWPDSAQIELETHHVTHHPPVSRMQRCLVQPSARRFDSMISVIGVRLAG